jgi:hypothetical protein
MSTPCPSGIFPQIFPNYRYFNQPIELVPGWDQERNQVVGHAKNSGLQWIGIDQCMPVVTCLTLEPVGLIAERKTIPIFSELNTTDCTIDTTDCSCCEWNGIGNIFFDIICNGQKIWKSIPITWTKISNYKWIYNGQVPGCINENLNWQITCNSDLPATNCSSKWQSTVFNFPCRIGPFNPIMITSSNINTFGFPPEIIQSIQSLPYWPNACACDTPAIWYVNAQLVPNCGCCP